MCVCVCEGRDITFKAPLYDVCSQASVMIGGLRTVMNGAFPVHTNDLLMFYFNEELDLFENNGSRKNRIVSGTLVTDVQNIVNYMNTGSAGLISGQGTQIEHTDKENLRRNYYDRANGNFNPSKRDQKINIFSIKPYIVSNYSDRTTEEKQYFPCDKARIFGRAISNAQPFEMVDIQLSRQAI